MIYKQGNLRGEKILFKDGVNICFWYPVPAADRADEDFGLCFDVSAGDLDDLVLLLMTLREAEPEVYEE